MTNEELLAAITAQFNELKGEIKELRSDVEDLKGEVKDLRSNVEDLKEDCEITRDGVNTLLEWADTVGKITNYPIAN